MIPHPTVDVLCVGYACVDLVFETSHHPGEDEKLRARAMHTCGGGPAANAAVAIARLGGSARFCGFLGKDAFGQTHLDELVAEKVCALAVRRGHKPTPVAAVTIKPNGARSIVDYCDVDTRLAEDAIQLDQFPCKVLLLDGHQPLISIELTKQARAAGIAVVLDAGSVHDGTEALLGLVDYLIVSEKFAKQYSQESSPRSALAALDGLAPLTAVTWGAGGVYWQDENGQHHTPAFDMDAVDTTGAGDAFHGAFALAVAQGTPLKKAMRYASAVGALTCLKIGARTALPRADVVDKLLHAND